MICQIYIIAISLRFINASLNVVHEIYNRKESIQEQTAERLHPTAAGRRFLYRLLLIISILIGKSRRRCSPDWVLPAAILMLVFKDTILGFVAGIQLSINDMLRPGDWITMEKYGANGRLPKSR